MSVLAGSTWNRVPAGDFLVVPLGATEQHGPHLPLDTDSLVIEELCRRLGERRESAWIAPVLPFGASGEHAGFRGTISLGAEVACQAVIEIGRSADDFEGVLFPSWHGGNFTAIERACRVLRSEGRNCSAWIPPRLEGFDPDDLHAGRMETSLLMKIRPGHVRPDAEPGPPGAEVTVERLAAEGVKAVSPNGVLGDPAGASLAEGERILADLTGELVRSFDRFAAE